MNLFQAFVVYLVRNTIVSKGPDCVTEPCRQGFSHFFAAEFESFRKCRGWGAFPFNTFPISPLMTTIPPLPPLSNSAHPLNLQAHAIKKEANLGLQANPL